jgi:hypothetical protein
MRSPRRRLLHAIGTLGAVTLSGCSSLGTTTRDREDSPDPAESSNETTTPSLTPTATLTQTPVPTPIRESYGPTPPFDRTTKIAAGDGEKREYFGYSAAMSGDGSTVVVGAIYDRFPKQETPDGEASDDPAAVSLGPRGSAVVYSRTGRSWTRVAKLVPDVNHWQSFGQAVAIADDGLTAVVLDDDPGSANVFSKADGQWRQTASLTPADGDSNYQSAYAVSTSADGSKVIVGDAGEDNANGQRAGAAYVHGLIDDSWEQRSKLTPVDGDPNDQFGNEVELSNDGSTAIVGAEFDEDPNGYAAGSAYIFAENDGAWRQTAKLTAADGNDHDGFGLEVALSGDGSTAIVGALDDETDDGDRAGSVYVFSRAGGAWPQDAKITPFDRDDDGAFGFSIAVSDDGAVAIITDASDDDPHGGNSGSAYLYRRSEGSWSVDWKLVAPDGDDGDSFGRAAAMAGDASGAVITAAGDEDPNGKRSGSAYLYE